MRNENYYFCSRVPSETLSPKYTTSLNILVKYMSHLILDMYKSVHHPQTADVLSVSTGPSVVCNDVQILIRVAHETSWAQICNLCSRNFTLPGSPQSGLTNEQQDCWTACFLKLSFTDATAAPT